MAIVTGIVAAIDPGLPAGTVAAAVTAAAAQAGQRHQLAWALQDRPELLTGGGAAAPVPSVLRLIDQLREAGASGIVRPACPRCGRVIPLVKPRDGVRLCRNCVARSRAEPCSRCGTVREAATRDEHGQPLCPHCLITDPANQETCAGCGRRRPVSVRTPDGPLCPSCRPWQIATCGICGRQAPCVISQATGEPWCRACKQRWARCSGCGQAGRVRGGTRAEPLCVDLHPPRRRVLAQLPGLRRDRPHPRRAVRPCAAPAAARAARRRGRRDPPAPAGPLRQDLAAAERPATVRPGWTRAPPRRSCASSARRDRSPTPPSTNCPTASRVEHLRSVLVATGTLPPRDEQLTRLERWITDHRRAAAATPASSQLLHRYAIWHVLRRLRGRTGGAARHPRPGSSAAQRNVKAAIALLDWLTARDLTLAHARQGDLETWLAGAQASHRPDAGNFVRWARRQKLTSLDFAATRWGGPSGVIDTEARWEQARWLLHDDSLKPEDRVAGLLVLLYAQWPSAISRLTLGHVQADDGQVRIRLGREPVILPEPLAALVRAAARHPPRPRRHRRRGHLGLAVPRRAARTARSAPTSLTERLRQLGI